MATGYRPYTGSYTASRSGYAPGGVSYKPLPKPKNAAARGFAPGGNYGYNTGGPLVVTPNRPHPGGVGTPPAITPAAPSTTGPAGAPPSSGPAFGNDPIYQQIVAIANQNVAGAQAAADAARKQLAIEFGDPSLIGLGTLSGQAAQANPFSALKNLLRGHLGNVTNLQQRANVANLWSSSARTREQEQEQVGYSGQIASAAGQARAQLTQIAASLLAAQRQAEMDRANAASDAYGRAAAQEPIPEPTAPVTAPAPKPAAKPKPKPAAVKRYTASATGYAPGGVAYKPIKRR